MRPVPVRPQEVTDHASRVSRLVPLISQPAAESVNSGVKIGIMVHGLCVCMGDGGTKILDPKQL